MRQVVLSLIILCSFSSCSDDSLSDNVQGKWILQMLVEDCEGEEQIEYDVDSDGCIMIEDVVQSPAGSYTITSSSCSVLIIEEDFAYWEDQDSEDEPRKLSYTIDESETRLDLCVDQGCLTLSYEDYKLSFSYPVGTIAEPESTKCSMTFTFKK